MSEAPSATDALARRRLAAAADLGFFTSSAASFHPKPYNPSASSSSPVPNPPSSRAHLAHPLPPMDPSPSDPIAVFIHPPFTNFPEAHRHPGGLTYALMAANPEWFLDPNDFISTVSTDPGAITYPSQLEPPRGWCPAKKKDLKDRGSGSWPEGEEPRLRCTFCRRTYAGVNAKSMWRRHVFEKHKIAMANRRDTVDRTRKGVPRESKSAQGKENQTAARSSRKGTLPLASPQPITKTKLRSLRPAAEATISAPIFYDRAGSHDSMDGDVPPAPSAPLIPQEEFSLSEHLGPPLSRATSHTSATPPPDSPGAESDARESHIFTRLSSADDDLDNDPPTPTRPTIPSSPYDPRATPSFRHSPPRLPSDQPWRFPSPNHPLHCMAEISLSQITIQASSPPALVPNQIDASPVFIAPQSERNSVFDTPTPASGQGASSKLTPRRLFPLSGGIPASLSDRLKKSYRPVEESPLRHSSFTPHFSRIVDELDPISGDPFTLSTPSNRIRSIRPPSTSPESDSPVMRTTKFMDPVSSSSGGDRQLMAPFSLKLKRRLDDDDSEDGNNDDDDDDGFLYSGSRLHLSSPVSRCRLTQSKSYSDLMLKNSPSTSRESSSSNDPPPSRKRRRTLVD